MATRTIKAVAVSASVPSTGDFIQFEVTSDTGPVPSSGVIKSATMEVANFITPASGVELHVKFGLPDADTLAVMGPLTQDGAGYGHTESMALSNCQEGLLTGEDSYIFLVVGGAQTDNAVIIDANTTVQIDIDYIGRCTAPGNVGLSAHQSTGDAVVLSWSAGAGGADNALSHYELARQLSTDGGATWGDWEVFGTTVNTYALVEPPATVGHQYRLYVRTVGTAGDEYGSYWARCYASLRRKANPVLIEYTDPIIEAGVTKVKAVHITELQTNINLVRTANNYMPREFTAIRASYTSLAGWNAHILELRAAIDGMGVPHETWLALGDNCPRADVLMQLRRVVEAVADD